MTETYVVDPLGLSSIAQTYDSSGNLSATFAYGLGLAAQVDGNGDAKFYTTDITGNITGMTGSGGALTDSYFYDPFGGTTRIQGSSYNPFEYSGAYGVSGDETGLDFMRARFYDPEDGRFTSRDPIGINGGINLYQYAGNEPLLNVDPNGLSAIAVEIGHDLGRHSNTVSQLNNADSRMTDLLGQLKDVIQGRTNQQNDGFVEALKKFAIFYDYSFKPLAAPLTIISHFADPFLDVNTAGQFT